MKWKQYCEGIFIDWKMGNKHSCCVYTSPSKTSRKPQDVYGYDEPGIDVSLTPNNRSATSLPGVPHISDRENYPEDSKEDPTSDPSLRPLFPSRSQSEISKNVRHRSRSKKPQKPTEVSLWQQGSTDTECHTSAAEVQFLFNHIHRRFNCQSTKSQEHNKSCGLCYLFSYT